MPYQIIEIEEEVYNKVPTEAGINNMQAGIEEIHQLRKRLPFSTIASLDTIYKSTLPNYIGSIKPQPLCTISISNTLGICLTRETSI